MWHKTNSKTESHYNLEWGWRGERELEGDKSTFGSAEIKSFKGEREEGLIRKTKWNFQRYVVCVVLVIAGEFLISFAEIRTTTSNCHLPWTMGHLQVCFAPTLLPLFHIFSYLLHLFPSVHVGKFMIWWSLGNIISTLLSTYFPLT